MSAENMVTNALASLSSTTGESDVDNQNVQTSQALANATFVNVIWTLPEGCHHKLKYLTTNIIFSGQQLLGILKKIAKR